MAGREPILLFDGVCNLCDFSVQFIIARDRAGRIRFGSLQGQAGQALLRKFGLPTDAAPFVVLVEGDRHYTASTAALRVMKRMDWPWRLLYAFILVPRPLRDLAYGLIARNRYRILGKRQECMIPTPEIRSRFIE